MTSRYHRSIECYKILHWKIKRRHGEMEKGKYFMKMTGPQEIQMIRKGERLLTDLDVTSFCNLGTQICFQLW